MFRFTAFFALVAIALLAGCSDQSGQHSATPASDDSSTSAHAELAPASGSNVHGNLSFVNTAQGVHITGRISGLQPGSTHGFHIHENGDCSAPDASSAGGHFNPSNQPHGQAGTGPHHAGDMPNQKADTSGVANVDVVNNDIELGSGNNTDAVGHAVVVHAKPDDYTSQPSGDAGSRIACAVITND